MLSIPSLLRSFAWVSVVACGVRTAAAQEPAPELTVIEGRVVDMRGEGVPAAKVWVTPRLEPDQVLARTVADGDGYFRTGRFAKREGLRTRATADGYCVAIGTFDANMTTVTLQQAATVTGVLRNKAGQPIANTTVVALVNGRSLYGVRCEAPTDAEGRFVLRGVPLAPVQISAWIPGEGVASIAHHVAADSEVVLQPGNDATTTLAITVEGMSDEAVATTRVGVMQLREGDLVRLPPPLDAIRMPQPTLRLELLPDADYRITAQAPGWQFTPAGVTLKSKRGPHAVKFTAAPADMQTRSFPIEVRDSAGQPVAGVALVMRAERGGNEVRGTTDADGKVTMRTPLAVGSKAILASIDDRWVTDQDRHAADSGQHNLRDLDQHEFVVDPNRVEQVRVVAACSVRGRLLQHDGRPASYAWVELQEPSTNFSPAWMGLPTWMGMAFTTTDRDGYYVLPRLHCSGTEVRVSTRTALGSWDGAPVDLSRPGTEVRLADARLARPAILEGVLRDTKERPVGGVRVRRLDWDMETNRQREGSVDEILTDAQGRYRFLGVPVGGARLWLQAGPGDQSPWTQAVEPFEVEAGKTYTFDLQLPAAK